MINLLVYIVIFLQISQTAFESYDAYVIDSVGWGNPDIIFNVPSAIAEDLQLVFESISEYNQIVKGARLSHVLH